VRLPLQSASLEIMPLSDLELDGEDVSRASVDQTNLSLKGLHILAVDDNLDSLAMMKHMLEDLGAQVAAVASAKEVMSALKASPDQYDILLSDIGMPDEDGFSLIRQVRALEANKGGQIPAASVTAYVSDKERQKALAAGFQAHIQKPINLDQMISAIINLTR